MADESGKFAGSAKSDMSIPQQKDDSIVNVDMERDTATAPPPESLKGNISIKIAGLERPKKRQLILKLEIDTSNPRYRSSEYHNLWRTHSEILKLADHLIVEFPGCLIPAVPQPVSAFGAGTKQDKQRLIEDMQYWFNTILEKPGISDDSELQQFIEGDAGYSPMVDPGKPTGGLKRRAIKAQGPPPDDAIELTLARSAIKQFYKDSDSCKAAFEKVLRARNNLALAQSEFGLKVMELVTVETHRGLANALEKLGRAHQLVGDINSAFSINEAAILGDRIAYYSHDAFIVKEILSNRNLLHRELLQTRGQISSKQAHVAKMRHLSEIDSEDADSAFETLERLRHTEDLLSQRFEQVTQSLILETRLWTARTSERLRRMLKEYARSMIEHERRLLGVYEDIRPGVRAIDSTGGLSRLGREHSFSGKDSVKKVSQTLKSKDELRERTDSWSGVQRLFHDASDDGSIDRVKYRQQPRTVNQLDAKTAASFLAQSTL